MTAEEYIQHQAVDGSLTFEDKQYVELSDVRRLMDMAVKEYTECNHSRGEEMNITAMVCKGKGRSFNIQFSTYDEKCNWVCSPDIHFESTKQMDRFYRFIKNLVREVRKPYDDDEEKIPTGPIITIREDYEPFMP